MVVERQLKHRIARALCVATLFLGVISVPHFAHARERVAFPAQIERGSIIIRTNERKLYLVLGDGTAIRYAVAVGKPGKQWFGEKYIDGKYVRPAWSPPAEVKRDKPQLPDLIAGGHPSNPMGERALTIAPGADYAIHGTNQPNSIGRFASYGCIRMRNADIVDLYQRVRVGTRVIVTR
jgi:lipoprotein-anchoring transpeptidase ErfK/SrfK